ncbi:hypothetical protein COS55_01815 [Candidatus Shapirobacteria bacterium CG03_land_8_20_14_0_80_40_19]|uniref:HTH marR-type domain-containing protein n=3 Tax=Candidatus Shapironibacteriota TaxID=1752721 RepID=A0A2M7BE85_9BACT|nr:MAG: hypothetical protein COV89_03445 [Candidatus Shapirobacteria bacterium CG11_big_fil_rev_8_21_14_0_20_40_12]PIV01407.1 MAG: hypothetical protein COS55_01815 [Candidatus Shapirobacteria bacterium CG03_land_8_20_14_0_80_40_19]PJC77351.1 MAG: hypothetical protein CO010_00745 [Candidatus Shapirobacteria bacterium CG_4_8_14_3_um_filter_39_11]
MNLGERILEKAVDIALVGIYFNIEIFGAKRKDWKKLEIYVEDDFEELNYETIKRSITYLRKKGLIQTVREKHLLPKITKEGQKRLSVILPHYDEKREWDK